MGVTNGLAGYFLALCTALTERVGTPLAAAVRLVRSPLKGHAAAGVVNDASSGVANGCADGLAGAHRDGIMTVSHDLQPGASGARCL